MRVPKRNVFVYAGNGNARAPLGFFLPGYHSTGFFFDFFCPLIDLSKQEIPLSDPRSCTLAPPVPIFSISISNPTTR